MAMDEQRLAGLRAALAARIQPKAGAIPGLPMTGAARGARRYAALRDWQDAIGSIEAYRPSPVEVREDSADHNPRGDTPGASNVGADLLGFSTRCGNSQNWSGLILAASDFHAFGLVRAEWTLPAAEAVRVPEGGTAEDYRASIWIGLDGHRRGSPSMPQVGTTIRLRRQADGSYQADAYAWSQWWVRGKGGQYSYTETVFEDFAVRLGDRVACVLNLDDSDDVFFAIHNMTTGARASRGWVSDQRLPTEKVLTRIGESVAGAAACFIVEAPTVHNETRLYPLPDFGAVDFAKCQAQLRPLDLVSGREARDRLDLAAARQVRIFERRDRPQRTELRALPVLDATDRRAFRVRYKG